MYNSLLLLMPNSQSILPQLLFLLGSRKCVLYGAHNSCMHAKSLQLCPILCNPMNCSPPDSSVHGILQQEFWSGLPFPSPADLPDPGIEPPSLVAPALQVDSLLLATGEASTQFLNPSKRLRAVPRRRFIWTEQYFHIVLILPINNSHFTGKKTETESSHMTWSSSESQ